MFLMMTCTNRYLITLEKCTPCDNIDFVTHCEINDDNCLNVSRHRPILCCFNIVIPPVETVGNMKQCLDGHE